MSVKSTIYLNSAVPNFINWKFITTLITLVLTLAILALDKDNYLASQKDIFLRSNEALQVLPGAAWQNITSLGDAYVVIPLFSFVCLFSRRAWAAMFASIPLAIIFTDLGKKFFAMPRPAITFETEQFHIVGSAMTNLTSFPSGHTITIFTAMSAIWFVILKSNSKTALSKYVTTGVLCLIAIATAISRIAVGAHWPADIIAGAALGIISGMSGEYLSRRYLGWWNWINSNQLYLGYSVIFFSALLLFLSLKGEVSALPIVWVSILSGAMVGLFILLKLRLNK